MGNCSGAADPLLESLTEEPPNQVDQACGGAYAQPAPSCAPGQFSGAHVAATTIALILGSLMEFASWLGLSVRLIHFF